MKRLAELEELQIRILHRISDLELSHLPYSFSLSHSLSLSSSAADDSAATTEHRLSAILRANAVRDFSFKRVPSNYYDWTLEAHRDVLAAASIDHLCKSIVLGLGLGFRLTAPKAQGAYALAPWPEISSEPGWLAERPCQCLLVAVGGRGSWAAAGLRRSFCDHRPVGLPIFYRNNPSVSKVNTQAPPDVIDCSNRNYSKYYVVVVQYTARFNAETVKNFLYTLNNGKISKKKFNMRLAPEETSAKLTGYEHNGVTCIGMKTDIPVILDEAIVKLNPDFFWLGGGEIDLKLGIRTSEFINYVKPFIINCSGS